MKRIILSVTAAAVTMFCATAFAAKEDPLTDEQRFGLAEIEQYIEAQKQMMENRYTARMAEVEYRQGEIQKRLLTLEIGDNRTYIREAKFSDWAKYIEEVLLLNGVDLRKDKEYARALEEFRRDRLWAARKVQPAPKLLAIAEKRLADERIQVNRLFALERLKIENERRYAVEVQLADLEKKLKEQVLNPTQPKQEGVVTGIVYSQDKPAAIVGSQVVHPGEKIGKVQVITISPDSVEFEKGGKRWTQQTGDEPGAEW
jgi:hypothetical protein